MKTSGIASALAGFGVTLASTFAPSLGLSVHQQRIGFALGVALMIAGGLTLLLRSRKMAGQDDRLTIHNVISKDQRGGITAHTVNMSPQPGVQAQELQTTREGTTKKRPATRRSYALFIRCRRTLRIRSLSRDGEHPASEGASDWLTPAQSAEAGAARRAARRVACRVAKPEALRVTSVA